MQYYWRDSPQCSPCQRAMGLLAHITGRRPQRRDRTNFSASMALTDGGFGGTRTIKGNGAKGPATLNNTDTNSAGDYAGVYYANTTMSGQPLTAVTQLGYTYSGTTHPTPGDLSLNVPVNNSGGTTTMPTCSSMPTIAPAPVAWST